MKNFSKQEAGLPAGPTRHAIILAAGESTRTRPLTLNRPKPLISLLGQPLLAHILDELVGLVTEVTLVVGYRAEAIRTAFGSRYRGIDLHYVYQHEVNGTAGALLTVAAQGGERVQQPFFLLYGDNLISQIDLPDLCQHRYSLVGLRVDDPRAFGVLNIVNGQVTGILEKPANPPPDAVANPGIYHFDEHVFPLLQQISPSPRGEYELTDLIALLAQEHAVYHQMARGYWIPVGTPWDVLVASAFLLERGAALRPAIHPDTGLQGCLIEGAVRIGPGQVGNGTRIVGPSFIADGVIIGSDCLIEQSVLEAGAIVSNGCHMTRSIVGTQARIGANSQIADSLIDDGAQVGKGSRLQSHRDETIRPIAETRGVLEPAAMQRRGVIVGSGVALPAGSVAEPGAIFFPQ